MGKTKVELVPHSLTICLMLLFILQNIVISVVIVEAQLPIPPEVPRGDVLIMGKEYYGPNPDPTHFNRLVPGHPPTGDNGYQQLCEGFLWYINSTNSELISWLAAGPPEYSSNFKIMKIHLRKGVYWNDGTSFTADDVVFTIQLYATNMNTVYYPTFSEWVDKVYKENDYTVIVELKKANPRFHYFLTVIIYDSAPVLPRHIWEGKDILTFKNYPPLCIGPYNLKAVDPGGLWFLWERYENWWGTKLYGMKPAPKYILVISYGTEEKDALAMAKHELETTISFSPENFEVVWKNIPEYVGVWKKEAPYAWPFDACVKGIIFNVLRYPFNLTEVRRAMVFSLDYREVWKAFIGIDGSAPVPTPLPIVRYIHAEPLFFKPLKEELLKLGLDPSPPNDIKSWLHLLGLDPEITWWKHDPTEAEELLKKVGFYRGSDGLWRKPSGEIWTIRLFYNVEEPGFPKMAAVVADQLERFGIKIVLEGVDTGTYWTRYSAGDFDFGLGYPGCSLLDDLLPHIQSWNSKYFDPEHPETGWANYQFPRKAELDELLNKAEGIPPWETEKLYEVYRRILVIWVEQLPWAGFFPIPFYSANNRYCWDGWPYYPDNYYMDPVYWWAQMLFIVLRIHPTGRCPTKEATMPGAPPKLPIEIPKPTQIVPTITTITITTAVPTTITTTVKETITVREIEWVTMVALSAVLFVLGVATGYLIIRRR
ncbi:MAG: ABC transporter substrate-binding protein [Ignisphaera sp.]